MKKMSAVIVGILGLLVTAGLFLLLGEECYWLPMYWTAFLLTICLGAVTVVLFAVSAGRPRRIASAMAFLLAAGASVLIAVLFLALWPFAYGRFLSLNLVVFGAAIATTVVLWFHDSAAIDKEDERASARSFFDGCCSAVSCMRSSPEGRRYDSSLKALEEDLRYLDNTKITNLDGAIREKLNDLAQLLSEPGSDPEAMITDLRDLIRRRQHILHP